MAEKNITVILAKRHVGNTVGVTEKPKLKVAAYCELLQIAKNKQQVMNHRLNITLLILVITLIGSLPEYLQTMVLVAQIQRNVKNLIE